MCGDEASRSEPRNLHQQVQFHQQVPSFWQAQVAAAGSTRYSAVDYQFANVQPPHFKVVDGQVVHTPTFHGESADGEPIDGQRTDRSCSDGERSECHRA